MLTRKYRMVRPRKPKTQGETYQSSAGLSHSAPRADKVGHRGVGFRFRARSASSIPGSAPNKAARAPCLIHLILSFQKISNIAAFAVGPAGIAGVEQLLMGDEHLAHIQRRKLAQQHVDQITVGMRARAQGVEIGRMFRGDARPVAATFDPRQQARKAAKFFGQVGPKRCAILRRSLRVAAPRSRFSASAASTRMKSIFWRRTAALSMPRALTMGSTSPFFSNQSAIWLRLDQVHHLGNRQLAQ